MMKKIDRREFIQQLGLKVGGAAVLFLVADELLADLGGKPLPATEYDWSKHHYGYAIDTRKCIGCGRCVLACRTSRPGTQYHSAICLEMCNVRSRYGGYVVNPMQL